MAIDRRHFFKTAGAGFAVLNLAGFGCGSGKSSHIRSRGVGMCDWNLGGAATPDNISKAKEAHLQGIQVSVGTDPNNIPLRDKAVRQKYLEFGKKYDISFHSVAAGGILNKIPLASEPQSAVYVIDAIEAAKALGAKNILTAFFGNGDLRLKSAAGEYHNIGDGDYASFELDSKGVSRVVAALRQIVPRAEDAGVVIGLENTLTAKQNLDIIDQIGSKMVQVYYDVGNSTGNGYNVPKEIRMLGNDRICEVHLKDWKTKMLGSQEGQVDMIASAQALKAIGYDKWLVLETSGRKDKFIEDTQTNVAYVQKTFQI